MPKQFKKYRINIEFTIEPTDDSMEGLTNAEVEEQLAFPFEEDEHFKDVVCRVVRVYTEVRD